MAVAQGKVAAAVPSAVGGLGAFLGVHAEKGLDFWVVVLAISFIAVGASSLAYLAINEAKVSAEKAGQNKRTVVLSFIMLWLVAFAATIWTEATLPGAIVIGLVIGIAGPSVVAGLLADRVTGVIGAVFGAPPQSGNQEGSDDAG